MQRTGKRIVLIIIFICFFLILFLIYSFLSEEAPPADENRENLIFPTTNVLIDELPTPDIDLPEEVVGVRNTSDETRDDRIYTNIDDEAALRNETIEKTPRLVRLFAGRTAGYRIDRDENNVWRVRVVEQGRGNRYTINTMPYSVDRTSVGEFTKVHEGHIFSDGNTLVLYEHPENELIIKSAFVPFNKTDTSEGIQLFEDNIRVATNNDTKLFFTKQVDKEVLGLIVNVSNPNETEVVWESDFTTWIPRWGRGAYITLSAPISGFTKGYVYLIDPERIVPTNRPVNMSSGGSIFMDTTSGYFILYHASRRGKGKALITDQQRKTDRPIPTTLPEKCDGFNGVFVCAIPANVPSKTLSGHKTMFPDSWYQGDIQLNDSVMLFDAVTGEERVIMSPDQDDIQELSGNREFDIINPRISEDGEFLFFVNKKDYSLWMLKINEGV